MKHQHHVIPRHIGGKDGPTVEVTVEEHAQIHYNLWMIYGRWQDEVAWRTLSGQIGKEEARILAVKRANTGRKQTEEHKQKRGILSPRSKESNLKRAETLKRKYETGERTPTVHSEEFKQRMRKLYTGKPRGYGGKHL